MNKQSWKSLAAILDTLLVNQEYKEKMIDGTNGYSGAYFISKKPMSTSITDYLDKIQKHAKCSDSCYIVAYIYLQKLLAEYPSFTLNKLNISKLTLAAIILAIKYTEDSYVDNEDYAGVGEVSLEELNEAEVELLELLDFKLNVTPDDIRNAIENLSNTKRLC